METSLMFQVVVLVYYEAAHNPLYHVEQRVVRLATIVYTGRSSGDRLRLHALCESHAAIYG